MVHYNIDGYIKPSDSIVSAKLILTLYQAASAAQAASDTLYECTSLNGAYPSFTSTEPETQGIGNPTWHYRSYWWGSTSYNWSSLEGFSSADHGRVAAVKSFPNLSIGDTVVFDVTESLRRQQANEFDHYGWYIAGGNSSTLYRSYGTQQSELEAYRPELVVVVKNGNFPPEVDSIRPFRQYVNQYSGVTMSIDIYGSGFETYDPDSSFVIINSITSSDTLRKALLWTSTHVTDTLLSTISKGPKSVQIHNRSGLINTVENVSDSLYLYKVRIK
jgi:hypothetical protein